jgi:hypothetical protein
MNLHADTHCIYTSVLNEIQVVFFSFGSTIGRVPGKIGADRKART